MNEFFFDFDLPQELIAQHPTQRRDESRLLVVNSGEQTISHHRFSDLPSLLRSGDSLVLNNTKVIPARLVGTRTATGGKWEGLFLNQHDENTWEILAKTRGYPHPGETFLLDTNTDNPLTLKLIGRTDDRHWLVTPSIPDSAFNLLPKYGHIPLPHYIRGGMDAPEDHERYQTVFAQHAGSVAAPTAGLHFTPELLNTLADQGIGTQHVTLQVGLGTFAPVKVDDPRQHVLHHEWASVTLETAEAIRTKKANGQRIIAVGTTTTRTLETAARQSEPGVQPFHAPTNLFIHEPFEFRVLDGLITNFHLPRTTLLLLVGAFAGRELLERAYTEAIREKYRFFSYGDAMLIL
jgi:S-adenosylmethionine:tRNA ribosyltransferase-isomerase